MFFRRVKPTVHSFSDRLSQLRDAGFQTDSLAGGKTIATRNGCGAELSEAGEGLVEVGRAGVMVGKELGQLTDVGYQKVFTTPSGRQVAARAEHLKALHAFTEDLRETLGLTSFYNQSLGTTNELHLYDRVENRDAGEPHRPWER